MRFGLTVNRNGMMDGWMAKMRDHLDDDFF